jgi:carbon monoxide dehydrogenase subunit G
MEMTGEYKIPAPRLKACIPGCQELNKESDTELSATVKSKVGPVSATFKGKVTLSDIDAPNGYKISGEGTGGVAGFAKGGAEVSLVDDGDGTLLNYTATGQVGGKLAQIGSRLIDSTAKKMANEFFGKFADVVAADNAAPEASAEAEAEAPAAPAPEAAPAATPAAPEATAAATAQSGGGTSPVVWVGGLIVAVVVVLALLV